MVPSPNAYELHRMRVYSLYEVGYIMEYGSYDIGGYMSHMKWSNESIWVTRGWLYVGIWFI